MKIIYVAAGMGRSGSTLVDMMLSAHPDVTGLGEVRVLLDPESRKEHIRKYPQSRCICGPMLLDCPVWGRMLDADGIGEKGGGGSDYAREYERLLDTVSEMEKTSFISDSSKYAQPLQRLAGILDAMGMKKEDLRILHLIRDARGQVHSHRKRRGLSFLRTGMRMREWKMGNRELISVIERIGSPSLRVGYEELCFYPEPTMRRICDFAGLEFDEAMLSPGHARGHVATGNPMRLDATKSKALFYDHGWFLDPAVLFWYLAIPGVHRRNMEWVYENIATRDEGGHAFQPIS